MGQGDKAVKSKNTPSLVESLVEHFIIQVSCGSNHTLALAETGVAFAWGFGKSGALGTGRSDNLFSPAQIPFQYQITDVHAGGQHSAFLTQDHSL